MLFSSNLLYLNIFLVILILHNNINDDRINICITETSVSVFYNIKSIAVVLNVVNNYFIFILYEK